MLTTDRMIRLMTDEVLGNPHEGLVPEEEKYLVGLRKNIEEARENGQELMIPNEWPGDEE